MMTTTEINRHLFTAEYSKDHVWLYCYILCM